MADYLFGVHAVGEWLRADPSRIDSLLVAGRPNDRVRKLIERAEDHAIPIESIDTKALRRLSGPRNPQGVGARVAPFPFADLEAVLDASTDPVVLVVDGVTDPGNLGALIRSASFFGVNAIVLPMDRSAAMSPTVERSAAGAAARLPICQVGSLVRTVREMAERGFVVVASIVGGHPPPWEVDLASGPTVLMVGSEGKGLRPSLRKAATVKTSLPSRAVESLNVSVFGALLLYETARQRSISAG